MSDDGATALPAVYEAAGHGLGAHEGQIAAAVVESLADDVATTAILAGLASLLAEL